MHCPYWRHPSLRSSIGIDMSSVLENPHPRLPHLSTPARRSMLKSKIPFHSFGETRPTSSTSFVFRTTSKALLQVDSESGVMPPPPPPKKKKKPREGLMGSLDMVINGKLVGEQGWWYVAIFAPLKPSHPMHIVSFTDVRSESAPILCPDPFGCLQRTALDIACTAYTRIAPPSPPLPCAYGVSGIQGRPI
jgi:hypothetical protein